VLGVRAGVGVGVGVALGFGLAKPYPYHTHLPPSLRKEERAGRLRKEGGAQFLSLVEGKRGAKGQVNQGATELKKGLLASFQGKSSAKGPSLEA
jgi:hypothetical protein